MELAAVNEHAPRLAFDDIDVLGVQSRDRWALTVRACGVHTRNPSSNVRSILLHSKGMEHTMRPWQRKPARCSHGMGVAYRRMERPSNGTCSSCKAMARRHTTLSGKRAMLVRAVHLLSMLSMHVESSSRPSRFGQRSAQGQRASGASD